MKLIKKNKIFSNEVFDVYKNDFSIKKKVIVKNYLSIQPKKKYNQEGGIMVIPIKNNKIGLMKVNYPIIKKFLFCFPQGFCDKGESLPLAALREFNEETGFILDKKNIKFLAKFYPNPSLINSKITVYTTEDLTKKKRVRKNLDEIGVGKISFYSKKEVILLMRKKNFDLTSLNALLFYFFTKKNLR